MICKKCSQIRDDNNKNNLSKILIMRYNILKIILFDKSNHGLSCLRLKPPLRE